MQRRDLDHHAVDDPRQPRRSAIRRKIAYGLYEVTAAPEGNWAKTGDASSSPTSWRPTVMKAAKVEARSSALPTSTRDGSGRSSTCAHPLARARLRLRRPAARRRPRHRRGRHRLRAHRARPRRRGLRHLDGRTPRSCSARGIDTDHPLHRRRRRRFTKDAPGFEGKRVIDEKGDKGDANEAVIKALIEAGSYRARPAQASVSALLALEEAGDLPQHAAVVHRHGQAARPTAPSEPPAQRTRPCARSRSQAIERDRVRAGVGREPHRAA